MAAMITPAQWGTIRELVAWLTRIAGRSRTPGPSALTAKEN